MNHDEEFDVFLNGEHIVLKPEDTFLVSYDMDHERVFEFGRAFPVMAIPSEPSSLTVTINGIASTVERLEIKRTPIIEEDEWM